jgi:hypothetical protein
MAMMRRLVCSAWRRRADQGGRFLPWVATAALAGRDMHTMASHTIAHRPAGLVSVL